MKHVFGVLQCKHTGSIKITFQGLCSRPTAHAFLLLAYRKRNKDGLMPSKRGSGRMRKRREKGRRRKGALIYTCLWDVVALLRALGKHHHNLCHFS